jgi:Ca-activated chloride channel family protein
LTDLEIDFGTIKVHDIYPDPLPDLFAGTQVIILGRYKEGGSTNILIRGKVNGQRVRYVHENYLFANGHEESTSITEIPRLWATRKIGYLLNNIRLYGPAEETVTQIIQLSIRYGIITPYTSFLVTEPKVMGTENQEELAQLTFRGLEEAPAAPTSGRDAVEKAAAEGQMTQAEVVESPGQITDQMIKVIGSRTFVKDGEQWVDTNFDPATMDTIKIAFLSADYFTLAGWDDQIAGALALGEQVIFILGGKAYQIVNEDYKGNPINLKDIEPTKVSSAIEVNHPTDSSSAKSNLSNEPAKNTSGITKKNERNQSYFLIGGGMLALFVLIILYLIRRSFLIRDV